MSASSGASPTSVRGHGTKPAPRPGTGQRVRVARAAERDAAVVVAGLDAATVTGWPPGGRRVPATASAPLPTPVQPASVPSGSVRELRTRGSQRGTRRTYSA